MIIGLENQFSVFLRVAVLHRFYCILLIACFAYGKIGDGIVEGLYLLKETLPYPHLLTGNIHTDTLTMFYQVGI